MKEKVIPICELKSNMKVKEMFEDDRICSGCPNRHECSDYGRCVVIDA
jgi:hypothetical protein